MQTASITLCADQLAGPLPDGAPAIPSRDRSIDPDRRLMCDLGKVRHLCARNERDAAGKLLASLPAVYPDQFGSKQLPRIKMALRTATNGIREAEPGRPLAHVCYRRQLLDLLSGRQG